MKEKEDEKLFKEGKKLYFKIRRHFKEFYEKDGFDNNSEKIQMWLSALSKTVNDTFYLLKGQPGWENITMQDYQKIMNKYVEFMRKKESQH